MLHTLACKATSVAQAQRGDTGRPGSVQASCILEFDLPACGNSSWVRHQDSTLQMGKRCRSSALRWYAFRASLAGMARQSSRRTATMNPSGRRACLRCSGQGSTACRVSRCCGRALSDPSDCLAAPAERQQRSHRPVSRPVPVNLRLTCSDSSTYTLHVCRTNMKAFRTNHHLVSRILQPFPPSACVRTAF